MNALAHQGDVGFAGFDDCGYRVMSSDEQQKKRKSRGLCQTCGEVRTHRPGLLKSMQMPETIEGLVYKGICLKCNSLDAAKMQLCEPLDGPDNNDRLNNVYGSNRNKNTQSPPGYQKIKMAMPSQDAELNLSEEPERGNSMKDTTKKNAALKSFEAIYQRTASARKSYMTKEKQPVTAENEENDDDDDDDDDGELSNPSDDVVDSVAVNQRVAHVKEKDQHSNNNNNHSFNSSRMNNSSNNSNMNNISNSSNMNNSSNNNMNNNSFNNISGCSSKNELKKEAMNDFRCADSNGDSGFFTGTVISQHTGTSNASGDHHQHKLPHGRGEMVYDEGRIAKGVWVNGLLKIQVKSDRGERYEPYLLAGFSIGHMGYEEDMVNTSRGETVGAVSKLHVNDCAFIRRSDGSWSYAIVKSRTDGETPSITFQVNFQGSTKTISLAQWGGYVRTPTKPDILPQYSIGDPGNEKDMIIEASKTDTVKAVSKLKVNDAAFVKRSDMSWAYAILVDRSSGGEMKFEVNARGSTKVIALLQCGKFVRRVKKADDGGDDGLTEEEASAIFKSMKTVVAETNE